MQRAPLQRALVVGASGGIGSAVAEALEARGAAVTRFSRSRDGLDVTDEASVEAAMGALDRPYDLVLVATGALVVGGHAPEKSLRAMTRQGLMDQFAVNALGPAMVLKHALRLLPREGPSVFAALSARVGSIGDNAVGGWHAYRAAKAALNQILHGSAIEIARTHPQAVVLALHPGTVATRFTADYAGRHPTVPPDEAAASLLAVIEGATPAMSGGFYDSAGREIPW